MFIQLFNKVQYCFKYLEKKEYITLNQKTSWDSSYHNLLEECQCQTGVLNIMTKYLNTQRKNLNKFREMNTM